MAEQSDIKTFHITGDVAKAVGGFEKKRRNRTVRKKQEGGDESVPVIKIPSVSFNAPMASSNVKAVSSNVPAINIQKVDTPVQITIPRQPVPIAPLTPPVPIALQEGGVRHFKVELKKKSATKKVQLHPKKTDAPKMPLVKKNQTRKARKVLLGVTSLHKRMTRAKKLHKKTKDMPIEKLKEELIKKKLIKPTSKAPEAILRQIAVDAQIVATKSL